MQPDRIPSLKVCLVLSSWYEGWFNWFSFDWMSSAGAVGLAIALVILCGLSWALNLLSLPGNWIAVGLVGLYAWIGPSEGRIAIGFLTAGICFAFALAGEVLELAAGAAGAKKAGASRRSTIYAMVGSMIGAVGGAIIGIPVPVLGPVIAAVLFGGLGATAGAMYGEWTDGRAWKDSWSIGHAAFWGRTFGVLGKTITGLAIVAVSFFAVLF